MRLLCVYILQCSIFSSILSTIPFVYGDIYKKKFIASSIKDWLSDIRTREVVSPRQKKQKLDIPVPKGAFFSKDWNDEQIPYDQIPKDTKTYDYIVVGCGASGCPLAGYLADKGQDILVLERGLERNAKEMPNAMNINGAGVGLADGTITQPVSTLQGVRTFTGIGMGGGTSVNLGIVIGETEEFFDTLAEKFPGFHVDYALLKRNYDFIVNSGMGIMPLTGKFSLGFAEALKNSGYEMMGETKLDPNYILSVGKYWQGYSLFNPELDFHRNAADFLALSKPNITLKTKHIVKRVAFIDTPSGPTAECVIYRPTNYQDIRPIGNVWDILPSSSADWSPWIKSFLYPTSIDASPNHHKKSEFKKDKVGLRRACLTTPGKGRIVLSAGAIHTPVILYRSGIGPMEQLKELESPVIHANEAIGTQFSDRVFISVPGFLKNPHRGVPLLPLHMGLPLRRLAEDENVPAEKIKTLKLKDFGSNKIDFGSKLDFRNTSGPMKLPMEAPEEILVVEDDLMPDPMRLLPDPPVVLPDYLVHPGPLQKLKTELEPRICPALGIKKFGPECSDQILDPSLKCSLIPLEEAIGSRTTEGFIYASRFVFPPAFRRYPILDGLIEFLSSCANLRTPFNVLPMKMLCPIAWPVIACFRRTVAPFYFTAEPKSRGTIKLKKNGDILADPKYLHDEKDLFDAVRGVSVLIEQLNSDVYRGFLEEEGPEACPLTISNGLLDLLLTLGSMTSPFMTDLSNFSAIQKYLQDLIPPQNRRARRLMIIDETQKPNVYTDEQGNEYADYSHHIIHNVDTDGLEKLGVKENLKKAGFDFESYEAHIKKTDASANNPASWSMLDSMFKKQMGEDGGRRLEDIWDETSSAQNVCDTPCEEDDASCPQRDICCLEFGNPECIKSDISREFPTASDEVIYSAADATEFSTKSEESLFSPFLPKRRKAVRTAQWAASFPPVLPSTSNPKSIAKFALTYMTSIGHLYGSAPMGQVVDSRFRVNGVNGLNIVDASVLPQLTRMNPTLTLMALGRVAAEYIIDDGEDKA